MMLHQLPSEAASIPSPPRFTFPFAYTPHPLCRLAAREVIAHCYSTPAMHPHEGKMFGVLVVDNPDGHGGRSFLAAFSGIYNGSYHHEGFVPPVFDLQAPSGYFQEEEHRIDALSDEIAQCADKAQTATLKALRKEKSNALQMWTFRQFRMLNARQEAKDLMEIFHDTKSPFSVDEYLDYKEGRTKVKPRPKVGVPPGGAGECCAPKLLQYAYQHGLHPICMAEFWVGPASHDDMRREGDFYPSCQAKCFPILSHMLQGLDTDPDPMVQRCEEALSSVETLYDDPHIMVVYKPAGLLSVPCSNPSVPSLLTHLQSFNPSIELAHRLDMDTSGLLIATKSSDMACRLQKMFFRREIKKKYIAILEEQGGHAIPREGTISLPLSRNPFDRPRQMVDHKFGKPSVTHYIFTDDNRVELYPETGRTHQLRIHCAHAEGLGRPIKGDVLYGQSSDRLYLHAESIDLIHPATGLPLHFERKEL